MMDEERVGRPEYAGFFPRVAALTIDLLVVHLAYLACFIAVSATLWPGRSESLVDWFPLIRAALFFSLAFPLFLTAYFCSLHAWQGQTLGKMCLGIKVVLADGGGVPSLTTAFLRLIGYALSALPFGIGFLWPLVDPEKRAFHDILAATRVECIHRERPG